MKRAKSCGFCKEPNDCPSIDPGRMPGYACTREAGHAGDHVTCLRIRHHVAKWKNTPAAPTDLEKAYAEVQRLTVENVRLNKLVGDFSKRRKDKK